MHHDDEQHTSISRLTRQRERSRKEIEVKGENGGGCTIYLYKLSIAAGPNANPLQKQIVLNVKGSRPTYTHEGMAATVGLAHGPRLGQYAKDK